MIFPLPLALITIIRGNYVEHTTTHLNVMIIMKVIILCVNSSYYAAFIVDCSRRNLHFVLLEMLYSLLQVLRPLWTPIISVDGWIFSDTVITGFLTSRFSHWIWSINLWLVWDLISMPNEVFSLRIYIHQIGVYHWVQARINYRINYI